MPSNSDKGKVEVVSSLHQRSTVFVTCTTSHLLQGFASRHQNIGINNGNAQFKRHTFEG